MNRKKLHRASAVASWMSDLVCRRANAQDAWPACSLTPLVLHCSVRWRQTFIVSGPDGWMQSERSVPLLSRTMSALAAARQMSATQLPRLLSCRRTVEKRPSSSVAVSPITCIVMPVEACKSGLLNGHSLSVIADKAYYSAVHL